MRLLLLALLIAIIAAGFAVKLLPWWASVAGLLGLIVVAKLLARFAGRYFRRFFLLLFQAKAAVLKDAAVRVHAIRRVKPPAKAATTQRNDDDDEEEEEEVEAEDEHALNPDRCYLIDVTIDPKPATSKFQHWEPGELALVVDGSKPMDSDSDGAKILRTEVMQDSRFVEDEGWKLHGTQRLRLYVALHPGVERLRLRYYLVDFGGVFTIRRLNASSR